MYLASEVYFTDGPFESPQDLSRLNLLLNYDGKISESDRIRVVSSFFRSSWDASGQIPQRAVDSGLITRWGAIDDTEGGTTGRFNILLEHLHSMTTGQIKSRVFYSNYDFDLFSNFTFLA